MRTMPFQGYTLIELMLVVILIGIFAGLAADMVGDSKANDLLTKAADNIQGIASRGRSQVLQDHRAYVFEFRASQNDPDQFWVNALVDGSCWSAIATHCIESFFNIKDSPAYQQAHIRVARLSGYRKANLPNSNCGSFNPPSIGAICFSGSGDTYFRPANEANADCSSLSGTVSTGESGWVRVCGGGIRFHLNRFNGSQAVGVERVVLFPPFDLPYVALSSELPGLDGGI